MGRQRQASSSRAGRPGRDDRRGRAAGFDPSAAAARRFCSSSQGAEEAEAQKVTVAVFPVLTPRCLMHRRAGQVAVDGLEVIEPRDQLVELAARLGLGDVLFHLANAGRDDGAVDVLH